jgi:class 3 adenylate cyclase
MTRWFRSMREVVERHGGTVQKFIGDAVMAVFGIPVTHEDDALRAVRAGGELSRAKRRGSRRRLGGSSAPQTGDQSKRSRPDPPPARRPRRVHAVT